MSFPCIKVVDLHHNNEEVPLGDLTQTALGSLIHEGERLLEELKDAEAQVDD